jgi:hypothetical protein
MGTLEAHQLSQSQVPSLHSFLEGLVASAKRLHLTGDLLRFAAQTEQDSLSTLVELARADPAIFEHVAATLADEALVRAEGGVSRLFDLAQVIPSAAPSELVKKYILDAVECYLLLLDHQCIAMCRAALEVLVEQLHASDGSQPLGRAINSLKESRRITSAQARDMWTINNQAKEVLHAEPGAVPPNARDCLTKLAGLIGDLHERA